MWCCSVAGTEHRRMPPPAPRWPPRPDYAGTFAAIWLAMSTAEFFGSTLHVLTSTTTLFFTVSARPQAFQPVEGGSCRVEVVLMTPLALDIGPTVHFVLDWMWV